MKKGLQVALAGVVGLVVVAGGVLWADPFGWRLWQRWTGGYDATITAVPRNSTAYVGLNLLNVDQERLGELVSAFADSQPDTPASLAELDQQMVRTWGISLDNDIRPWLGQYAGFALLDVVEEIPGQPVITWVGMVESLDQVAADVFLQKLQDVWANKNGLTAESRIYKGISLTVFDGLVFGRSDNLVLFASSEDGIKEAIETQGETSLADSAVYQEAVNQLPEERMLTVFLNGSQLRELLTVSAAGLSITNPGNFLSPGIEGTAVALLLTETGVQIDAVTLYNPDRLSATHEEILQTPVEEETAVFFPANTIAYLTGLRLDVLWENYRDAFIAETSEADFADSMALFADEFGLNPDRDLFPLLDGTTALGVLPVTNGGVGVTAVIHTTQPGALTTTLETFSATVGNPQTGIGTVTPITSNGAPGYQLESVLFPGWAVVYGLQQEYLFIGSEPAAAAALLWQNQPSLANHPPYQQIWQTFPADMQPVGYVDVDGLEPQLNSENIMIDITWLQPVSTIVLTGKTAENSTIYSLHVSIP